MSLHTFASLARQMARLVVGPRPSRRRGPSPTALGARERFGLCPACRAFIGLGEARLDGLSPCPRCGREVEGVEPLG